MTFLKFMWKEHNNACYWIIISIVIFAFTPLTFNLLGPTPIYSTGIARFFVFTSKILAAIVVNFLIIWVVGILIALSCGAIDLIRYLLRSLLSQYDEWKKKNKPSNAVNMRKQL